ncbi:heavy-metal-associated domain-containing protein [Curtobacterium sp. AB451]|uniref:heavy-metal-associated domain-containing protein n=1 Tax=unclassified Curtobacterium TaxID=257496 RepID=UPI0003B4B2D1|nr:heavy-metal-associated domain-containing protein [Curtobacterium sp. B18]
MTTELLLVEGMTCDHCVMSVTEELGELDGVSDVRVRLVPGGASEVTVTSAAPVPQDALRAAVAEAGYEVVRS